jgi:hypothetical protein
VQQKLEALKDCFKGSTMISGNIFSHVKHILLALEKDAFLGHFKPVSLSTKPNPHRSRLATDSPRWYYRKEEDPHLHMEDRYKGKT